MNRIRVRPAAGGDADTLVGFNRRMARETEGRQLDPGILAAGVKSVLRNADLGFYLVAEIDGRVVGSLMVTKEWSDWRNGMFWWIQSVYVAPGWRRRGVFRALHEEVRKRAGRSTRVCGYRLYVERDNVTAQAVYARLGMTETRYKIFEAQFPGRDADAPSPCPLPPGEREKR